MASIVERTTKKGERRLYVTFGAVDRGTGAKRKIWLLEPTGLLKDARATKARVEVGLRMSGGRWPVAELHAAMPTFDEYADAWLERRARQSVSDRVLENYAGVIRRDLSPAFGSIRLDEIRRRHVNDLVGALALAGKAHNTIRNVLVPLRKMMNDAVDDELLAANPALRITIPANAPTRTAVIPTTEQLERIMATANVDARDVIGVVAALGLRRGEVFALRWRDVDFGAGLVSVAATNHRGRIADRTKTAAGTRLVPLFDSARKTLLARRLRLRPALTDAATFVFAKNDGGPVDPGNWYRREWLPAVAAAGPERFHFHDLRHFAATRLDEQGMSGKLRTEIIGHADERITNSVYTHIGRERLSAAASSFDPLAYAVVDQR